MYSLINGVWTPVGGTVAHTHTTADITGFGSYPDATAKPATKIPTTDGAGGWTFEDPVPAAGVPAGGSTGQFLAKASNADYDIEWGAIGYTAVYSVDIGAVTAATPVTVTHNLGTRDVVVSLVEKTVAAGGEGNGDIITTDIAITSENAIELTFTSSAPANQYRVTIVSNGSSAVEATDIRVQVSEPTNPIVGTVWVQP